MSNQYSGTGYVTLPRSDWPIPNLKKEMYVYLINPAWLQKLWHQEFKFQKWYVVLLLMKRPSLRLKWHNSVSLTSSLVSLQFFCSWLEGQRRDVFVSRLISYVQCLCMWWVRSLAHPTVPWHWLFCYHKLQIYGHLETHSHAHNLPTPTQHNSVFLIYHSFSYTHLKQISRGFPHLRPCAFLSE